MNSQRLVLIFSALFLFACGAPAAPVVSIDCDADIVQPVYNSSPPRFSGGPELYSDALTEVLCKPSDIVSSADGSCTKACAPAAGLLKVCDASGAIFYLGSDGGPLVVNYGTIEVKNAQCSQLVIGPLVPAQLSKPLDCVTKAPASWGGAGYRVYKGPVNCGYPVGQPSGS
jgi:hypothetical protein